MTIDEDCFMTFCTIYILGSFSNLPNACCVINNDSFEYNISILLMFIQIALCSLGGSENLTKSNDIIFVFFFFFFLTG